MNLPTVHSDTPLSASLVELVERAKDYGRQATSSATRRAYASDWSDFAEWCAGHARDVLPARPETVGLYLADRATALSVASLTRRLAAIASAHRLAGFQLDTRHPGIASVLAGIRRVHGTAQRRAAPATIDVIRVMIATCDSATLIGLRDRALLLLGFASALRRSELVALRVDDVEATNDGLRLSIRRSKTDQGAEGQVVAVMRTNTPATCPVTALAEWRAAAAIDQGPLFRGVNRHGHVFGQLSDRAVARVIQRRAVLAGLDAVRWSGHSLRAGFATTAAAHGVEERHIQRQTRHKSVTVLRRYIREGELFRDNASGRIGL